MTNRFNTHHGLQLAALVLLLLSVYLTHPPTTSAQTCPVIVNGCSLDYAYCTGCGCDGQGEACDSQRYAAYPCFLCLDTGVNLCTCSDLCQVTFTWNPDCQRFWQPFRCC
jgi:hypothetical protein